MNNGARAGGVQLSPLPTAERRRRPKSALGQTRFDNPHPLPARHPQSLNYHHHQRQQHHTLSSAPSRPRALFQAGMASGSVLVRPEKWVAAAHHSGNPK